MLMERIPIKERLCNRKGRLQFNLKGYPYREYFHRIIPFPAYELFEEFAKNMVDTNLLYEPVPLLLSKTQRCKHINRLDVYRVDLLTVANIHRERNLVATWYTKNPALFYVD